MACGLWPAAYGLLWPAAYGLRPMACSMASCPHGPHGPHGPMALTHSLHGLGPWLMAYGLQHGLWHMAYGIWCGLWSAAGVWPAACGLRLVAYGLPTVLWPAYGLRPWMAYGLRPAAYALCPVPYTLWPMTGTSRGSARPRRRSGQLSTSIHSAVLSCLRCCLQPLPPTPNCSGCLSTPTGAPWVQRGMHYFLTSLTLSPYLCAQPGCSAHLCDGVVPS